jgi:hypothetical protein
VERDHAEVRRRTHIVMIFPKDASLLRLSTALAMDRNEQWASRRYLVITQEGRINRAWTPFPALGLISRTMPERNYRRCGT